MTDTPHFQFPFSFRGFPPRAEEVEQDSIEEIAACVEAICLTNPGQRFDQPDFGLADLTFETDVDDDAIVGTIQRWEPRVTLAVEQGWDIEDFILQLRLKVIEEGQIG